MRKRSVNFIYALALYSCISVCFTSVQFLLSGALVYLLFKAVTLCAGPLALKLVNDAVFDAAGFAFLTATTAFLQYYLASLLDRNLGSSPALSGIVLISAIISSAFFLRLSAHSAFGSYVFSSLPLMISFLIGALTGLFQKGTDNPFRHSKLNIFRID